MITERKLWELPASLAWTTKDKAMIPYEDAIHGLIRIRADVLEAAIEPEYKEGSAYWSNPVFALFRDNMPSEADMEQRTCRTLALHLNIGDSQLANAITNSYSIYGYHGISHAILTGIVAKRLAEIYLPHHPEMQRVVILAALLHDAYHTHGKCDDTINIVLAQRFTRNLVAVCGERLGYLEDTAEICNNAIAMTTFHNGNFPYAVPASAKGEPLPEDATRPDQISMVKRILCESDLMMSATPHWPLLACVLAHDIATQTRKDEILDITTFCATQTEFIRTSCVQRLAFPETIAAMTEVLEIHNRVFDAHQKA